MAINLGELLDAYKAIHTIREFADKHSDSIDLVVRTGDGCVNPIAALHNAIQERCYKSLRLPLLHRGQIAFFNHTRGGIDFVDAVQAYEITEG